MNYKNKYDTVGINMASIKRITMIAEIRCVVFLLFNRNITDSFPTIVMIPFTAINSCRNHNQQTLSYERILYMILGFLASFIGIGIIISVLAKRSLKTKEAQDKNFWAREAQANNVRRKPLDKLNYIHIPLEQFPMQLLEENSVVKECIDTIQTLSTQNIVNFTGWSNTDLKLEYGTANLTPLTEYDQNFTVLVRTLQKWADALTEAGYAENAAILMEFAISAGTDISSTYYQLADYWLSKGENTRIEQLIQAADNLHSANKAAIIRNLKEKVWGDVMQL